MSHPSSAAAESNQHTPHYYYIHDDTVASGPYDLLDIIRKIRNQTLTRDRLISTDMTPDARPAYNFPQLHALFLEQDAETQRQEELEHSKLGLGGALREGFTFLKEENTTLALVMGFALIFIAVVAGALTFALPQVASVPPIAIAAVTSVVGYSAFAVSLVPALRLSRVQLLTGLYFSEQLSKHGMKIALAALFPALFTFFLPWLAAQQLGIAGWGLLLFPGLPVLAYCFFWPLLMVEYDVGFRKARRINRQAFKTHGIHLLLVITVLLALNLVAFALFVIPAFIMLPVTIVGLVRVFDEYFFN